MRASSKQQTSLEQLPLEDSWKALRGRLLRRRVVEKVLTAPPVEPVIKWTLRFHDDAKRPLMLVVPGDTTHTRMDWYRKYLGDEWASFRPNTVEDIVSQPSRDWVEQSVLLNFTERLAAAKIPRDGDHRDFDSPTGTWEFLWALGQTEGLTVNGPLREMVDQPHYLFHEVYLVFWSLRFRIKENGMKATVPFFNTVVRWLTGEALSMAEANELESVGATRRISTDRERMDVLFFILTIAEHNALLNRYVMCFDGLERALTADSRGLLRELHTFLLTLDRWVRLAGTPVGVLIGMDTSQRHMSQLRRLHDKLADEVEAGLAWTRKHR